MRPVVPALLVGSLLGVAVVVGAAPAAASTPGTVVTSVPAGHTLRAGDTLASPNGRFRAAIETAGNLVERTSTGRVMWSSPRTAAGATLIVARDGGLTLRSGAATWSSRTSGAGSATTLRLGDDGVLGLVSGSLTVWSTAAPNQCPRTRGRTFVIDLSQQRARMCTDGQQLRTTLVTTGATAKGAGTPRGTWHVQSKVRNTTLYPDGGGAYPVRFWVPYDGAYGIHDSSWQRFAYGSAKYRTDGSHGCTHVPAQAMAWFFGWARIGTTVTIR